MLGWGSDIRVRLVPGLPGALTDPVGVHFVCPKGDYDVFLEARPGPRTLPERQHQARPVR